MTAAQDALNEATGEYVESYRDNGARIRELEQQLQSDLTDTQKKELDAAWTAFFGETLPTRATVGVADLGGGALIEVVVTATRA